MTTVNVETRSSVVPSNDLLSKPLGWCDDKVETYHFYIPRKYFVKVEQTSTTGGADPVVFEVIQDERNYYVTRFTLGPHYQWGRKDPFLSWTAEFASLTQGDLINSGIAPPLTIYPENKAVHSPAGYTVESDNLTLPGFSGSTAVDVSNGIQNPYRLSSGGWWGGSSADVRRNLWNMVEYNAIAQPSNDYTFVESRDRKVYKTVYDPCPPGFSVPGYSAFTLMTVDGNCYNIYGAAAEKWVNYDQPDFLSGYGANFFADAAKTRTIYIPKQEGRRFGRPLGYSQGSPPHVEHAYYLTSKANGNIYSTCFTFTSYWTPPGPVAQIALGCAIAVLPAKEK